MEDRCASCEVKRLEDVEMAECCYKWDEFGGRSVCELRGDGWRWPTNLRYGAQSQSELNYFLSLKTHLKGTQDLNFEH